MNSKILLISPKLNHEISIRVPAILQENLGIGYLASFLEPRGITADIVDLNQQNLGPEQLISIASNPEYLIIGVSVHSPYDLEEAINFATKFKKVGVKAHITLGGHYATRKDIEALSSSNVIDSIVRGEGEITLQELYSRLNESASLKDIDGISFKSNREIIKNKNRFPITDLDILPFPKRYNLDNLLGAKQRPVHMLTSRGCPGGCSFCVAPLNKSWRTRSADNVLEEIKELYSNGLRTFVFDDDNYLGHSIKGKERALKIAEGLINSDLRINYQVSLRVDDLDDILLKKFADSGVSRMRVGIESFNQRQLDSYNKRTNSEQVIEIMQKIIDSGIEPHFSFITFDPYVSLNELEKTVHSMRRFANNIHFRYVTAPLDPIEESVIWKHLKQENLLIKNGDKYSFKFIDSDSGVVWDYIRSFKEYMIDVENEYHKLDQKIALFEYNKDTDELLKLKKVKKEVDLRMTMGWLDILQYSIESVKGTRSYWLTSIPDEIKQKHDELAGLIAQNN